MTDDPVEAVTIDFLSNELANDVRASLDVGITAGAVFADEGGPDELFRASVRRAIKSIESKDGWVPRSPLHHCCLEMSTV